MSIRYRIIILFCLQLPINKIIKCDSEMHWKYLEYIMHPKFAIALIIVNGWIILVTTNGVVVHIVITNGLF